MEKNHLSAARTTLRAISGTTALQWFRTRDGERRRMKVNMKRLCIWGLNLIANDFAIGTTAFI
jgi:hypothetical protein